MIGAMIEVGQVRSVAFRPSLADTSFLQTSESAQSGQSIDGHTGFVRLSGRHYDL